jgi:disulfide bond formation protein DsbB
MDRIDTRSVSLVSALAAGVALAVALVSEHWGGLVPCALCLLERWPYRIAIVLSLLAYLLPRALARPALWLVVLTMLSGATLGAVHVGVERGLWASPLPECAAPHIAGTSVSQLLASMPAHPAKPCDAPSFLVPGLPLSMATMNLIYAALFAVTLASFLLRPARRQQ